MIFLMLVDGNHMLMLTKRYQARLCECQDGLQDECQEVLLETPSLLAPCVAPCVALLFCPPILGWTIATSIMSLLSLPELLLLCPDKNNMFAG